MHVLKYSKRILRVALFGVSLAALAACSNVVGPNGDAGTISAQASGKFSGGTIFSGSIEGLFEAVGLGKADRELFTIDMTVDSVVWFSCVNKGGNEAPGQFDYFASTSVDITAYIDENGRYVTPEGAPITLETPDPTSDDCKRPKNWTVVTDDAGDPVAYMQPTRILVELVNNQDSEPVIADTLVYECTLPDPTYPLDEYEGPTALTDDGFCVLAPQSP